MRTLFFTLLIVLLSTNVFANYVVGNMCITGTGSTTASLISSNIGIGTIIPSGSLDVESTLSPTVFNSNGMSPQQNVGINSLNPGALLDVQGSIRMTGLIIGTSSGVTNTATTTCGCKIYKGGICFQLGTCS